MDKIKNVAQRLGIITVEDMERYTALELIIMIANKMNEFNEILNDQKDKVEYLLNEGLLSEVEQIFDEWLQDGTFDALINQSALKEVNDRIDETNAQLSTIELDVNSRYLNIAKVGAIGDGLSHKLSSKYSSLEEARVDFPQAVSLDDEIDLVAILKALSITSNIFIPEGTFIVNRQIDLDGLTRVEGYNRNQSVIKMVSDNTPILVLDGSLIQIQNIGLKYEKFQQGFNLSNAILKNVNVIDFVNINYVQVENAYNAIRMTNALFNCTFKNIRINGYAGRSIYIDGIGNTGCVFENIYTTNWKNHGVREKYQVGIAMQFQGFSESIISQINIEHVIATQAILFNDCHNITVNSFHIEGYEQSVGLLGSVIRLLSNSVVTIKSMTMSFSGYRLDDSSKQGFNLVSLGKNCQMAFNGIKFHRMNEIETWDESMKKVVLAKISTTNLHNAGSIRLAIKDTFDDLCSLSINGFKDDSDFWREKAHLLNMDRMPFDFINFNENYFYRINNGLKEVYKNERLSKGTYDVGDKNIFTTLIQGFDYIGEVCVGKGDFSQPSTGMSASVTPYKSAITVSNATLYPLNKGDRIIIEGVTDSEGNKVLTIDSSLYNDNQYNIKGVTGDFTVTDQEIKIAPPEFKGFGAF